MTEPGDAAPLGMATAPGKVILLGEHAVVYGQPALAVPLTAVEVRATVWAVATPLVIHAHFPLRAGGVEESVVVAESPTHALATAVLATLRQTGTAPLPNWSIEVASTVPAGCGLGSSAAIAVALVRAVARAAGQELDDAAASELALTAERVAHGTPSGIDNTVVALGRPIRFVGGQATPLAVSEPLTLLIADSGHPSATADMVAGVRSRRDVNPQAHDGWFAQIGHLANEGASALAHGNAIRLGRLMNTNHLVLQAMRVSTPQLDLLVSAARTAGALGAKLSGAGGGGVVIALVTPNTAGTVSQALTAAGAAQVLRTVIESVA